MQSIAESLDVVGLLLLMLVAQLYHQKVTLAEMTQISI